MHVAAVCPRDCYDTCFMLADVEEGRVAGVRGDSRNPVTRGFLCPRGVMDHVRMLRGRILHPYLRVGGKPGGRLRRVGWDEALRITAEKLAEVLKRHGSGAVLHLEYSGDMGLLTQYLPLRLWSALGASRTDYAVCSASGHAALRLHYGLSYGVMPEELPNVRLIVFWGFNAAISAPHLWSLSLDARMRGALIAVVDPRRSETAGLADIWVAPKPGSDAALAYGVARILITRGYVDEGFLEKWSYGYEKYKERALEWTPRRVEEATGVRPGLLESLAEAYGENKPSTTMIGFGAQKTVSGAETVRAVALLPALLGLHRGFYYSNSSAWIIDLGYLTGEKLSARKPRVVSQVALAEHVARGEFKFIYIYGTNPAATLPAQDLLRRGLARRDVFVVVHETHWNETTAYADIVLPAPTFLEKDDLVVSYSHGYIRLSHRVVEPLGESRSELWVSRRLAELIGVGEEWVYEDPWRAVEKSLENALMNGSFSDLLAGKTLRLKARQKNKYQTPTGRIEFYSTRASSLGLDPLPSIPPLPEAQGFILLNSSHPNYTHTQFREVYGPIPPVVHVNPDDAARLGVRSGDRVVLYNEQGEVVVQALITDKVPPGVLWAPKLLTGLNGKPLNTLAPPITQKIGGGSTYNSITVRVKKA